MDLAGSTLMITGGTGSFGSTILRHFLAQPVTEIRIVSRDEKKQEDQRKRFTDARLKYYIADVRDARTIDMITRGVDYIYHAAALKQVPSCEYAPYEAVQTNVVGAMNVARAILSDSSNVSLAIAISTDKACKPVNVMGMTKALQERIFVNANLSQSKTKFMCVRYGNVISSRGSVVPLFLSQIQRGGPVTVTLERMTRFLITLDQAVDTVFAAAREGEAGDTYVPRIPAVFVMDLAKALIGDRSIKIKITGVRPGEKVDEVMISEEEVFRTVDRGGYYVIRPMLPELGGDQPLIPALKTEYSSREVTLDVDGVRALLGDVSLRGVPH